jgi:hypothetical protein
MNSTSKNKQFKKIGKLKRPEKEEEDEKEYPDGWYTESAYSMDYPWLQKVKLFNHSEEQVLKKRERAQIEKQAELRQLKKPGNVPGDRLQSVPIEGTQSLRLSLIVPKVKIPPPKEYSPFGGRPSEWMETEQPSIGRSCVPIKNYTHFLRDPNYVTIVHDKLKGMMFEWRKYTFQFLKELHNEYLLPERAVQKQMEFANSHLVKIMKGVQKMNSVPINIMSESAILKYVCGVDDEEKANFVYNMANCEKFTLAIITHEEVNNCSVVTIFDENANEFHAYGKGKIENLSMYLHESLYVRSRKTTNDTTDREVIEIKDSVDREDVLVKGETPECHVNDVQVENSEVEHV